MKLHACILPRNFILVIFVPRQRLIVVKMACSESEIGKIRFHGKGKKICDFFKKAFWPVVQASALTPRKWTERGRLKARGLWPGGMEFRMAGLG